MSQFHKQLEKIKNELHATPTASAVGGLGQNHPAKNEIYL